MSDILAPPELSAPSLLGFDLPQCPPHGQSAAALADVAQRLGLVQPRWPLLASHLVFDPRQYRRVRLWRDADWEAILLCWLPGQRTAIHDHGGSTGVTKVFMGTLHERRFAWEGPGRAPEVVGTQALLAGEITTEVVTTIHEVANESHFPAASLHLYSPPLLTLGAYDLADGMRRDIDVTDSPIVQVGGNPSLPA